MGNILFAKHVTKTFGTGGSKTVALNDVSLSFQQGAFISIIGQSGSGKTTLLRVLSGLTAPTKGEVFFMGADISKYNDAQAAEHRRKHIGFVFQSHYLLPELTNEENIRLPLKLDKQIVPEEYLERIFSILGIADLLKKYPEECSGGEQQKVAIARAFANQPEIVFADEPTGNLDLESGENVISLFLTMQKFLNTTVIMVTHNLSLANRAERIITICNGRAVDDKAVTEDHENET